jgi:hypothetical protein
MTYHSPYGASKAKEWGMCPASVSQSKSIPDTSSPHATTGSAIHAVAESVLLNEVDVSHALIESEVTINNSDPVEISEEMAVLSQRYVDDLNELTPDNAMRLIEHWVSYSSVIGMDGAGGTADAIVLTEDEIHIHDLKTGHIQVDAEKNWQLMLYALGAYIKYGLLRDFKRARLFIHQVRHNSISEWSCNIDDLIAFGEDMKVRAAKTVTHPDEFNPGEEQCRWCKAKATCPALTKAVLDEFDALPDPSSQDIDNNMLARGMAHVDLVESWCKAVRAETERRLLNGHHIKGFKLVQGRRGPRKWTNAKEAEELLKSMRVKNDDLYDQKLISPTTAEKLVKDGKIGPRQWANIASHITQSDGKPSVAKENDAREPLQQEIEFEQIA